MMPTVDLSSIGKRAEPFVRSWTEKDAILYALGVGAGQEDPAAELEYTTENTARAPQQVVPSFPIVLMQSGLGHRLPFGEYKPGSLLHAEQELVIHRPLPPAGSMRITAHIAEILDKGSGALVRMEATGADPESAVPYATTRLGYFVRGAGGFGGASRGGPAWTEPAGEPDLTLVCAIRPDQALLYRLNGDPNPLHSDPKVAAASGFSRPILHGLCSYGYVTRLLVRECCDSNPGRLDSIAARFTKPVYPGDTLTTQMWLSTDSVRFRTMRDSDEVVLDRGTASFKP